MICYDMSRATFYLLILQVIHLQLFHSLYPFVYVGLNLVLHRLNYTINFIFCSCICLSIQSVYVYLSIYLYVCLPICLCLSLCLCLSVCVYIYLSDCVCLSVCISVSMSLSVCLSVYFSVYSKQLKYSNIRKAYLKSTFKY